MNIPFKITTPPKRLPDEYPEDYCARCGLEPKYFYRDIIFSVYAQSHIQGLKNPVKSFDVAVSDTLATLAAIQELVYLYDTRVPLGPYMVKLNRTNTIRRYRKRLEALDKNSPIYSHERDKIVQAAHKYLVHLQNKYAKPDNHRRLEIDMANSFRPQREIVKIERVRKKKNRNAREAYRSPAAKRIRLGIKKARQKKTDFMKACYS